tara:strand:- start:232 stop:1038 length:807 start_codon:yes stop_codon:yes gene_type:complete
MKKLNNIFLYLILTLFLCEELNSENLPLLSYQSAYEITLDKNRKDKNKFGKSTIKEANGELLLDWFNNCGSWSSNQRMFLSFLNSSGIGTVSDINYSITEKNDGTEMTFALQVKENNILVQRVNGEANKGNKMKIKTFSPEEKILEFDDSVIFPHQHLKEIINNLGTKNSIFSAKVYEGSIPNNFLNISTFVNEGSAKENPELMPKEVINKFWTVRMAYYKEKNQTPEMELTANINRQGVVSYFKYDYPEYSLIMKLKKLIISPDMCK